MEKTADQITKDLLSGPFADCSLVEKLHVIRDRQLWRHLDRDEYDDFDRLADELLRNPELPLIFRARTLIAMSVLVDDRSVLRARMAFDIMDKDVREITTAEDYPQAMWNFAKKALDAALAAERGEIELFGPSEIDDAQKGPEEEFELHQTLGPMMYPEAEKARLAALGRATTDDASPAPAITVTDPAGQVAEGLGSLTIQTRSRITPQTTLEGEALQRIFDSGVAGLPSSSPSPDVRVRAREAAIQEEEEDEPGEANDDRESEKEEGSGEGDL